MPIAKESATVIKKRLQVRQELKRLRHERDQAVRKAVWQAKAPYVGRIAKLTKWLHDHRFTPPPAIDRYLESADGLKRKCPGCGEEIMRATMANGQRLSEVMQKYFDDVRSTPMGANIIKMIRQRTFCCPACKQASCKGKEIHHRIYCVSDPQVSQLERELAVVERIRPLDRYKRPTKDLLLLVWPDDDGFIDEAGLVEDLKQDAEWTRPKAVH